MRRIYRKRLNVMDEALQESLLPGCVHFTLKGEIFFWIRLPDFLNCLELQKRANADDVDFAAGTLFLGDGHGGNYVRLNFTLLNEEDIRAGVRQFSREAMALID